jgi:hypothetical protein
MIPAHDTTGASITIGPRTHHEIELRIRELRGRRRPTQEDRRELARLTEFLDTVAPLLL